MRLEGNRCLQGNPEGVGQKGPTATVCSTYSLVPSIASFQGILSLWTHGKLQITTTLLGKRMSDHTGWPRADSPRGNGPGVESPAARCSRALAHPLVPRHVSCPLSPDELPNSHALCASLIRCQELLAALGSMISVCLLVGAGQLQVVSGGENLDPEARTHARGQGWGNWAAGMWNGALQTPSAGQEAEGELHVTLKGGLWRRLWRLYVVGIKCSQLLSEEEWECCQLPHHSACCRGQKPLSPALFPVSSSHVFLWP